MPTQLHIYSNGSFIDPQTMPLDQVRQRHRLHELARRRVKAGQEMQAARADAKRLLAKDDWIVEEGELHAFFGQYYQAAANPEIAKLLANDHYLTNYFLQRTSALPVYRQRYGEQLIDRAIATPLHLPARFLAHLYPEPPIIRMTHKAHYTSGIFWNGGELNKAWGGSNGFLPLPVTGLQYLTKNGRYHQFVSQEGITAWSFAVALFPHQELKPLSDLVLAGELPIVSMVVTPVRVTEVIFRIDAADEQAWAKAVKGIKIRIEQHGLNAGGWRYDTIAHAPSLYDYLIHIV